MLGSLAWTNPREPCAVDSLRHCGVFQTRRAKALPQSASTLRRDLSWIRVQLSNAGIWDSADRGLGYKKAVSNSPWAAVCTLWQCWRLNLSSAVASQLHYPLLCSYLSRLSRVCFLPKNGFSYPKMESGRLMWGSTTCNDHVIFPSSTWTSDRFWTRTSGGRRVPHAPSARCWDGSAWMPKHLEHSVEGTWMGKFEVFLKVPDIFW